MCQVTFESQHPDPFLEVRVHSLDLTPGLTGLCAGYESGRWRSEQLADHLMEWLPEFALTHSERESIGAHNALSMSIRAARTIYTSEKYQKRGEIGELLLHVAMCQVFGTVPAVAKYFFKDSANDTVKGFDAVHVVALPESLELWLGEVKFYKDIGDAIKDVVKELQRHTAGDYLRAEFAAITNKIDDAWPHANRLRKLLHRNTSLDEVFDCMCIPVFLTYDSDTIASHTSISEEFSQAFEEEVRKHHKTFSGENLPTHCQVHLFLLPLGSKKALVDAFDERLKKWQ